MPRISLPVSFEHDDSRLYVDFDPEFTVEFDALESHGVEGRPNGHYVVTKDWVRLFSQKSVDTI